MKVAIFTYPLSGKKIPKSDGSDLPEIIPRGVPSAVVRGIVSEVTPAKFPYFKHPNKCPYPQSGV